MEGSTHLRMHHPGMVQSKAVSPKPWKGFRLGPALLLVSPILRELFLKWMHFERHHLFPEIGLPVLLSDSKLAWNSALKVLTDIDTSDLARNI